MPVHYVYKYVVMKKKSDIIIVIVTILINGVMKCIKLKVMNKF